MRKIPSDKVEKWRERDGPLASPTGATYGRFIRVLDDGSRMTILSSGDQDDADENHPNRGWEHVSVSTLRRCPTWEEMDAVKRLFWDDSECVMQLHVPRSDHKNLHPYCLHLWKPTNQDIPRPPADFVA